MRTQLQELEKAYQKVVNESERDKALLEGKVQFLEHQREQDKKNYDEVSRKFESTLSTMQKQSSSYHPLSDENALQLAQVEIRFKKQIQEQLDEKQRALAERN